MNAHLWENITFNAARLKKMQAGAAFLAEILTGLLEKGLLEQSFWNTTHANEIAKRLIDFQLPTASRRISGFLDVELNDQNLIVIKNDLRWLYMLSKFLLNFDQLSVIAKLEVWQMAGATIKKELVVKESYTGLLKVYSVEFAKEASLKIRKTWVLTESHRWGCIIDYAYGNASFEKYYSRHQIIESEYSFYPALIPVRLLISYQNPFINPHVLEPLGHPTIHDLKKFLLGLYSTSPFLQEYPVSCSQMIIRKQEDRYSIIDQVGDQIPLQYIPGRTDELFALLGGLPGNFNLIWKKDIFNPII